MTEIQEQMNRAVREAEQVRRKRMGMVGIVAVLAVLAIGAVLDYQLILSGNRRCGGLGCF